MKLERSIFDEIDLDGDVAADAEGNSDIEAGRVISHDAMKAWLLSWGTAGELSPPKVGDEFDAKPELSDQVPTAKFAWEMPDDLAAEMAKPLPNCRPELDHLIQD